MGMGLHIITQPDMVDDPPASVLSCDNQGLVPGDVGEGDVDEGTDGGSGGSSSAVTPLFGFSFPILILVLATADLW